MKTSGAGGKARRFMLRPYFCKLVLKVSPGDSPGRSRGSPSVRLDSWSLEKQALNDPVLSCKRVKIGRQDRSQTGSERLFRKEEKSRKFLDSGRIPEKGTKVGG